MSDVANFRQRLDRVLRTRDSNQVRDFLVAEKQWSTEAPADLDFAMWMMIAGSPTLQDLHKQAQEWLISHGHEAEAMAVLGKGQKQHSAPASSRKKKSKRSI